MVIDETKVEMIVTVVLDGVIVWVGVVVTVTCSNKGSVRASMDVGTLLGFFVVI